MTRSVTFRRADRRDKKGLEVCVDGHGDLATQERPGCEGVGSGAPKVCGEGLIALLQRAGAAAEQGVGCRVGLGRRPECKSPAFPAPFGGPGQVTGPVWSLNLPICKMRAWSRPFCFKESISGLSLNCSPP